MSSFTAKSLPKEPEPPEEETAPQPETQITVPPAARGKNYMHLTVAQVEANYTEQLAQGSITRDQLQTLTWLVTVCKNEKYNLAEISEKIGYDSSTTLYRVLRGQYGADIRNVIEKIDAFRKLWEQRLGVSKVAFVETTLSRQIFDFCDLTRTYQVIQPIYGDTQTGKSFALEEYRRQNNHGYTIYFQMPADGHKFNFLMALCTALGVSPKGNSAALAARAIGALNENILLIIDEIHQTCISNKSAIKLNTIEFIRLELYEKVKCGIVLCGTNVFRDEVERGKHSGVLEQTRRRGMAVLQLPSMLPRCDMDALAASFHLPPAPNSIHELRTAIIKANGLRAYTNFMRASVKLAFNRGETVTWDHFVSAHDSLAKLSVGGAK